MYFNENQYQNKIITNKIKNFSFESNLRKITTLLRVTSILLAILGSMIFVQGLNYATNSSTSNSTPTKESSLPAGTAIPATSQVTTTGQGVTDSQQDQFQGFIMNNGQLQDSNAKYYATTNDYKISFEQNQVVFKQATTTQSGTTPDDVVVKFLTSRNVQPSGFKIYQTDSSQDTSGTQQVAFQEIWYYNIFNKIDLKYYMTSSGLKYEFIVKLKIY